MEHKPALVFDVRLSPDEIIEIERALSFVVQHRRLEAGSQIPVILSNFKVMLTRMEHVTPEELARGDKQQAEKLPAPVPPPPPKPIPLNEDSIEIGEPEDFDDILEDVGKEINEMFTEGETAVEPDPPEDEEDGEDEVEGDA